MKMLAVIGLALGVLAASGATAEETTVIHRDAPGAIVNRAGPGPDATIVEHRSTDVTGAVGCASKTVRKTNDEGDSKTIHKERCD